MFVAELLSFFFKVLSMLGKVELNVDYMTVVKVLKSGVSSSIIRQTLLKNICLLLDLHEEVNMMHTYMEANMSTYVFDFAPDQIRNLLNKDDMRMTITILVSL